MIVPSILIFYSFRNFFDLLDILNTYGGEEELVFKDSAVSRMKRLGTEDFGSIELKPIHL